MFDLLTDQNFLNALAAMIGPIAFFAAPSEEIESLLFSQTDAAVEDAPSRAELGLVDTGLAEAA